MKVQQISTTAIDYDLIAAAGDPGSPRRVMTWAALSLVGASDYHERIASSAHTQTWFGFVRAVAQAWKHADEGVAAPLPGFDGPPVWSDLRQICQSWGMKPVHPMRAKAGDVLMMSMPRIHMAVMVDTPGRFSASRFAHVHWTHEPIVSRMTDYWAIKTISAFTFAH